MSKKKKIPSRHRPVSPPRGHQKKSTPPIVRVLIDGFLLGVTPETLESAYRTAGHVVGTAQPKQRDGRISMVSQYVEQMAGAELWRVNPEAMADDSDVSRCGGDIQNAFMEPSFCLGFALAYRLFAETSIVADQKGRAR